MIKGLTEADVELLRDMARWYRNESENHKVDYGRTVLDNPGDDLYVGLPEATLYHNGDEVTHNLDEITHDPGIPEYKDGKPGYSEVKVYKADGFSGTGGTANYMGFKERVFNWESRRVG